MDMGELWHWLLFAVAAALGLAAAVGAIRAALGVPTTREKLEQARIAATQAIAVEQARTVCPQSITYSPNNALHWAPAPRVTGGTQQQAEEALALADGAQLIDQLQRALHLLVIGYSGGGKTTLMHHLAATWAQQHRVIVCDLDAATGQWPGCSVRGAGDDFESIREALHIIHREVQTRRQARAMTGRRRFDPWHVVIDEYQDVARHVDGARELIEDILRRGRKLDMHLVLGVQDKSVKTMGFEGQSALRQNFSHVVEVRADGGQRWARLFEHDTGAEQRYQLPQLPDIDALAAREVGSTVSPRSLTEWPANVETLEAPAAAPNESTGSTVAVTEQEQAAILAAAAEGLSRRKVCLRVYGREGGRDYEKVKHVLDAGEA
jgi:energy-coupling factor transporter ATP-binding protein EcfA2